MQQPQLKMGTKKTEDASVAKQILQDLQEEINRFLGLLSVKLVLSIYQIHLKNNASSLRRIKSTMNQNFVRISILFPGD